jgi:hypothetical protein
MQAYNIFVSYSRIDQDLVECVVKLLRSIGAMAFRDTDSIPAGVKWRPVLEEAIDQATVILVFWCTHSESSDEVRKEYQRAIDGQKSLIPILLDDTPLNTALAQFQGIDMRHVIGNHLMDSSPRRIERQDPVRNFTGRDSGNLMDSLMDLVGSYRHVDDGAEQRRRVFEEAAKKIYDSIPGCIKQD